MSQSTDSRIEPRFDANASFENISFLRKGPRPIAAPRLQRYAAYALVSIYVAFGFYIAYSQGGGFPQFLGAAIGTLAVLFFPVWISGWWEENKTQRTRYKVVLWTVCVALGLQGSAFLALRGVVPQTLGKEVPLGAEELAQRALRCERGLDLVCAEDSWERYLKLRADDSRAIATLGLIKQKRDDHAGAIREFEKSINAGNAGYDVFAFYAASLAKTGKEEEAIQWYYAALAAAPKLVDVREALAKLLLNKSRPYEALALLQAFDSRLEAAGRPAYFTAQRIAIERRVAEAGPASFSPREGIRLAAYEGHFFAPVTIGSARPRAFMVDTGATVVVLNDAHLKESKTPYRVLQDDASMRTADGRTVSAQIVLLEALQVGPHVLKNIRAATCKDCVSLLGVSALSRFDLQSSKAQGIEFLTLVPRT